MPIKLDDGVLGYAEKLYKEKIESLQGEIAHFEHQKSVVQSSLKATQDQLDQALASIESTKQDIESLKVQKVELEQSIALAQQKSVEFLEEREGKANARLLVAEEKEVSAQQAKMEEMNAHSKVCGLAKDLKSLADRFVSELTEVANGIKAEVDTYSGS